MALSSLNTNISSSATTFTFTTPIKLDRSNYLIWKSQILSSVRANELESVLDGSRICPDQFLSSTQGNSTVASRENPQFAVWRKQDQMLLSWLLSSISVKILSLVVNSKTSYELWSSLEQQFGSKTAAKKVHFKMMLNNLKKGSMTMTEYFSKLKSVTDELAIAGSPVSSLDFITHLISGLGQPYYPVVVYIEANVLKMSINEAYSMLLTHEARLESNQSNAFKEVKQNYAANLAHAGNNQKKINNQGGWNNNNQGGWNGNTRNKTGFNNWNGNFTNRGGFDPGRGQNAGRGQWNNNWNGNQGRGNFASAAGNFSGGFPGGFNGFGRGGGRGSIVCQICFKHNHTAADCKDRFNRNFVLNFSVQGNFLGQNQTSRAAFMATSEGVADQGWYLDSGATHHLTNNVENLAEGKPYFGSQLLPIHKGYKCLDRIGKVFVARHVTFNELEFPYSELFLKNKSNIFSHSDISTPSSVHFSLPQTPVLNNSSNEEPSAAVISPALSSASESHSLQNYVHSQSLHLSSRPSNSSLPVLSTHPMVTRSKTGIYKPKTYLAVSQDLEPSNVKTALADPRVKYNDDGSISRYKARLVAKGYHQTYGVDFFETFSLVIKPCTVRIILSLAVMNHWPIKQLDVNNAFLNGILAEDVYMHQPQGFVDSTYPSYVCKLNNALYGLKQAPRAWYDRLKESLVQWGFHISKSDTSLFIKHAGTDILLILIYVDDILVTGSNSKLIGNVIQQLNSEFALKDLWDFHYFLGIEVTPSVQGIHLSQTKYIGDILQRANMLDSKGCVTPMSTSKKLHKDKGAAFENPSLYRSIVGSLQYVLLTRPDLAFTVNKLSQFLSAPTILHWQACKMVLRYLQSTANYGLQFFNSGSLSLTAYSDADWGSDPDDRRSVGGSLDYILFQELNISFDQIPLLHCDNKSAEALVSNPKYHACTKHIELDIHFLKEHIAQRQLSVTYVPSSEQLADVLTKPLCFDQFAYLRSKLNVISRHQA
ncbi:retrovirus-related pol polyprotein from transposon RE1 [Citrus sinensis]|uniref:Retrovirus-related pol polyprotein from transposon RE1 n=1 Tax=Citrus sinensis TaxID=2711 RepID=A0ACB8L0M1_CITSI|nr:retrovirus-related pol polyprotein from transposon RE1 [Citrus sinensis]